MSNENDHADGDPDESVNDDKHRWDAKDLQKVTQFHEENDEMMGEMSNMSLGNLKVQPESISSRIIIRKEDVQLIVTELEVPRFLAERKLIEHNGDVIAALRDMVVN